MTLQQALLERRNSLNVVRLLLAAAVMLCHTWPLGQFGDAPAWAHPLGELAVPGFFCLSGFLIARSRMHLGFGRYLWHRCVRILPGFWVVLVAVAFVAAPISALGGGVWKPGEASSYVVNNAALLLRQFNIPGTISDGSWNGSLWSLFYEFIAYIGAGLLLTLGLVRKHAPLVTLALVPMAAITVWWAYGPGDVTTNMYLHTVRLGSYFLAGMVIYFFAHRLPHDWRLASASLLAVVACWQTDVMHVLGPLPLAYLLLWLGAAIPARWVQHNDVSYGIYIYAFPVQVMLEWFIPELPFLAHLVLSLTITTALAWASWLLVERPMLRLKNIGTRRERVTESLGSRFARTSTNEVEHHRG